MKNGLTSSQTGLILLSIPAFISPSPIPCPNQASRGFSTATALLLCSSTHPALPPSIYPLCHSQPTVTPCPPPPTPSGTDSCHCKPCSHSVLGCSVRMGSLLPCCSVCMTMCVHVCYSRRVSSLPQRQHVLLSDLHTHTGTETQKLKLSQSFDHSFQEPNFH